MTGHDAEHRRARAQELGRLPWLAALFLRAFFLRDFFAMVDLRWSTRRYGRWSRRIVIARAWSASDGATHGWIPTQRDTSTTKGPAMAEEIRAEMVANVWKVVDGRRRRGRRGRHAGHPRVDEDGDPGRRRVRRHGRPARRQRGRRRPGGRPDRGHRITGDRAARSPSGERIVSVRPPRGLRRDRPADRRRLRRRRPAGREHDYAQRAAPTSPTRAEAGEVLVAADAGRRGARFGARSCCRDRAYAELSARRARPSSACWRSTRPRRAAGVGQALVEACVARAAGRLPGAW